jgi:hypothetical protein
MFLLHVDDCKPRLVLRDDSRIVDQIIEILFAISPLFFWTLTTEPSNSAFSNRTRNSLVPCAALPARPLASNHFLLGTF